MWDTDQQLWNSSLGTSWFSNTTGQLLHLTNPYSDLFQIAVHLLTLVM
jgi:hypothetical protein